MDCLPGYLAWEGRRVIPSFVTPVHTLGWHIGVLCIFIWLKVDFIWLSLMVCLLLVVFLGWFCSTSPGSHSYGLRYRLSWLFTLLWLVIRFSDCIRRLGLWVVVRNWRLYQLRANPSFGFSLVLLSIRPTSGGCLLEFLGLDLVQELILAGCSSRTLLFEHQRLHFFLFSVGLPRMRGRFLRGSLQ